MRLQSTGTEQLLKQMGETQAETLNTAERHGGCLRKETRRSASGKISPTSAFRAHKVVVDEILVVGCVKITTATFRVMAERTLVSGYEHSKKSRLQFRDRRCTEDGDNKSWKKVSNRLGTYGVSQTTTTIS